MASGIFVREVGKGKFGVLEESEREGCAILLHSVHALRLKVSAEVEVGRVHPE